MSKRIKSVMIYSRVANESVTYTIYNLIDFLLTKEIKIFIEESTSRHIDISHTIQNEQSTVLSFQALLENNVTHPDLLIVVGGDGSILGACREIHHIDMPVLGINKGHLGFLTDLLPDDINTTLNSIINGEYFLENRYFLAARIFKNGQLLESSIAINEAVIHSLQTAHMIDFSIYIDNCFMYSQKADGLIISTPTGSTAYNLSAGGPIIAPSLDIMSLVPMFPHSMNCRPFIASGDNIIKVIFNSVDEPITVSCDGQIIMNATDCCEIIIQKSPQHLTLCHHMNYDYYKVLRSKLGYASKLVN